MAGFTYAILLFVFYLFCMSFTPFPILSYFGLSTFYYSIFLLTLAYLLYILFCFLVDLGFTIYMANLSYSNFKKCNTIYIEFTTAYFHLLSHPLYYYFPTFYFINYVINSMIHCYCFYYKQLSFKNILTMGKIFLYLSIYLTIPSFFIILYLSKFPSSIISFCLSNVLYHFL